MTQPWWWEFPGNQSVETLDLDECRALLRAHRVGRLAYSGPFGPRILPLSYTLADEYLLFRTAPGSDAAREVPQRWVAFEVDDLDERLREGWSVQVRGAAELLPPDAVRMLDGPQTPQPWVPGDRWLLIRVPLSTVTGRRVHAR